jgi:MYXO-CTERM domain-containing protein
MTAISKSHQPFVSKMPLWQRCIGLGVSISVMCLFLTASVSNAHASSLGNAVAHAVLHKAADSHVVQLVTNPLGGARPMAVPSSPEPNPAALAALGSLIGFVGWRLRRRSGQKTNS